MENLLPVILDGDPGHDDAIAWMLAKASPLLEIRAVSSLAEYPEKDSGSVERSSRSISRKESRSVTRPMRCRALTRKW